MTRYQLRAIRRAARINARLLAGDSHNMTAWYAMLDQAIAEFNIPSVRSVEYGRLIQAIEHYADVMLERAA